LRVVDQERRHAQPGGVADPQVALQGRGQWHGPLRIEGTGHVFDLLDAEMAQQVHREHLRAERLVEVRAALQAGEVGDAELAVAVHRSGAVEVADLASWCGSGCCSRPAPQGSGRSCAGCMASTAPAPGIEAAGLLQRHVALQVGQLRRASTSPATSTKATSHWSAITRSLRFSGGR
jgi:hypothetical protein